MISKYDIKTYNNIIMWPRQSRGHVKWLMYRKYTTLRDFCILRILFCFNAFYLNIVTSDHQQPRQIERLKELKDGLQIERLKDSLQIERLKD